jgi:hypothetical protein
MQADTDIVDGEPEVGRNLLSRLLLEICAPNDLGIVRPQRRH